MDQFEQECNDFLVNVFGSILKAEEEMIRRNHDADITISELHLIAAMGRRPGGCTVSELAAALDITASSVTIAANKLMAKDCLRKRKSESDRRSVYLTLTPRGEKLCAYHDSFHQKMVQAVASHLNQEEKAALMSSMEKLSAFFEVKHFRALLDGEA